MLRLAILLLSVLSVLAFPQQNAPGSHPIVGAPVQKDPNSIDAPIRNFALAQLEQASTGSQGRKIVKIIKATEQLVAGTLYTFTLELVNTDCPKPAATETIDETKCKAQADAEAEFCTVSVAQVPWETPSLKMTSSKCGNKPE